jgi:tetratricopeptide (TPR) repeat protein
MGGFPLGLRQVLESGDCVLFIGAGVGGHVKRPDGSSAPDGQQMAKDLCANFGIATSSVDLAKVAELVEIRKGRSALEGFVGRSLAELDPDETFQWLTTFRWRAIFTTNYDRAIERAYNLNPQPPQNPVSMSVTADLEYTDPRLQVPIFHLHGTLFGANASRIVITQTDYARFQEKRKMLWSRLKTEFATSTFLYIGYSSRDPNWQLVLDELTQEFYPSELPQSYRLDPFAEEIDIELLKNRHLETLKIDLQGFHDMVQAELGDLRPGPELITKYRAGIHPHLLPAFEKNPASLLRLLNSWEYVNGADFAKSPNTDRFLRGDKPSWSLVGAEIPFRRDIEEEVWDEITEFATAPKAKSKAMVIVAPAGYGVTTLLMSLAPKIVKARVGPVFMLRDGVDVLEGDVAFAASLFPDVACFFLVDQAREHAISLETALAQQRQTNTNCLFILGERKNEWRMARTRMKVEEYEIQPLSDPEINRLLDFLTRERALGKLEELDRDFQFILVKKKHEQQLLVAMREATEGEFFDVIIENEYRGIEDVKSQGGGLARDLYLLTSCFYQAGVLARDHLLAEILGKPLDALYEEIGDSLEGIVTFEETDAARGEYAARTRHRVIADIVWKRCGQLATKERILQSAMEKLNLFYRLDKAIFEKFVRSDAIVATFRSLDGKTRFFETACKRDPENPYVLQHFARMLLREKKPMSALAQIEAALRMDGEPRVLHHTRGTILADLAIDAESEDIGRKWMLQSEQEFKRCVLMNAKDDFSYQSLALLYLGWAKKVKSEDESSEYVTRCEQVISDGLRLVRDREALWIVSSDVRKWLGNEPSRIEKLKHAVSESSATSVIARYLLARAYRQQGSPEKAMAVLEPVVKSRFEEFRSFVEYVKSMLLLGEPYSKCIAVLSQCRLDGVTDPAYVGLLGGLLFMDGKTDEAGKVFAESIREGFSYDEKTRVQFRPNDPADPNARLRLSGSVKTVKPTYVFVQTDKYPDFISGTTKIGATLLQRESRVTFQPVFNAKGPYADHLRLDPAN